jgi:hypothetical protein
MARLLLVLGESLLERSAAIAREQTRVIVDAAAERRRLERQDLGCEKQTRERQGERDERAPYRQRADEPGAEHAGGASF